MFHGFDRVAIVGTAPSWALTPWADTDLGILSLNDAYQMDGFQRADVWYDFHPLDKMVFTPPKVAGKQTVVFAHTIPVGSYVRPHEHLDWLASQPMPKYLHPGFASQKPESAHWPNVHALPKAEIEAHFGRYFTSSPGWMLAHAISHGVREIHIYGIHLSSESEYIDQRPNFEFLCGCVLGPTKRTMTVRQGLRRYESQDGIIVLPEASPILASSFQYAFEPSPRRQLDGLRWALHKAEVKRNRAVTALRSAAWPSPWTRVEEPIPDDPNGKTVRTWKAVSTLQQEIVYLDALVTDCREQLARAGA